MRKKSQEIEDFDGGLAEAKVLRDFLGIQEGDPEYSETLRPAQETIHGVACYSFSVGGREYVVCSDSYLLEAYLLIKAESELSAAGSLFPGAEDVFSFIDKAKWVAEIIKNPEVREAQIDGAGTYVGDGEALPGYWYDIYER